MELFWKAALAVGGLAAIGAFVLWSLFKSWLSLPIFSKQTKRQTFHLMIIFLSLAFVAFGVCVWAFLVTKRQEPLPSPADPKLQTLSLFIRKARDNSQIKRYDLVKRGEAVEGISLDAIRAADDFKLSAQLSDPAFWYLVWLDTSGKVVVVASSDAKATSIDYPKGNNFVSVNKADPPGSHLILLLLSPSDIHPNRKAIEDSMQTLGKPPNPNSPLLQDLRGAGDTSPAQFADALLFLNQIAARLPSETRREYALFLQTAAP